MSWLDLLRTDGGTSVRMAAPPWTDGQRTDDDDGRTDGQRTDDDDRTDGERILPSYMITKFQIEHWEQISNVTINRPSTQGFRHPQQNPAG